jgi:hypothetical protein
LLVSVVLCALMVCRRWPVADSMPTAKPSRDVFLGASLAHRAVVQRSENSKVQAVCATGPIALSCMGHVCISLYIGRIRMDIDNPGYLGLVTKP